jgi:uncharacterized membrane protein
MRKIAELISLAALGTLAFITVNVFYGPHPLPQRIPTHFDAAGHANGWGSPSRLLLIPVVALALYLLLTVVAQFPKAFNYPVKVTESNRAQLEGLALSLLACVKAEMLVFFVWIGLAMIQAARHPETGLEPYAVFVFLGILLAAIIGHIVAMFRTAKSSQ